MKKIVSLALAALLCLSLLGCGAKKEVPTVSVEVAVSDEGKLAVAYQSVAVPDEDGDGSVSIDAVIAAAHDAFYEGGAAKGYASEEGEYGMTITKLWGVENGGSYGYCLNDASALPTDAVKAGDALYVYSFTDLTSWSDTYTYFTAHRAAAKAGEEVRVELKMIAYDENWNMVEQPCADAELTVNGESAGVSTGEDGSAVLTFTDKGEYVVSCTAADRVLVPAVCVVTVE